MRHFINVSRIGKYELLEGYAMVNRNFHIVTANEAMYQFMGIAKRYDIVDVIHPVDLDDFINVSNSLLAGDSATLILRMRRVDNSYRWMYVDIKKISVTFEKGSNDELLELYISDIIALERSRKELNTQQRLFRLIFSAEGESLFTYDHINNEFVVYRYIDDEAVILFNGTFDEMHDFFAQCSPQKNIVNDFFRDILSDKSHFKYVLHSSLINGDMYEPIELIGTSYFKNGAKMTSTGSIRSLNENATYSIFTYRNEGRGLILSKEEVHHYVKQNIAANAEVEISMILFQIDDYDKIIEALGAEGAASMYNDICRYMQDELGTRGVIGTYDEATVFLAVKDLLNDINLRAFLESYRSMISWKIGLMKYQLNLTFSIGVARYPFNGRDYNILVKKLDRALYLANQKGHNRYILYREHLHGEINE